MAGVGERPVDDSRRSRRYSESECGTQFPVGLVGVDFSTATSFDITPGADFGLALLTVGGATQLYSINLANGQGTLIGDFLDGSPRPAVLRSRTRPTMTWTGTAFPTLCGRATMARLRRG